MLLLMWCRVLLIVTWIQQPVWNQGIIVLCCLSFSTILKETPQEFVLVKSLGTVSLPIKKPVYDKDYQIHQWKCIHL